MRGFFLPALILVLTPLMASGDDQTTGEDPILKALVDELERSMTLQLEDLEKPYFVQYTVNDRSSYRIAATCGAVLNSEDSRSRTLSTQVRVGSYELDNTNFAGGGGGGFGRRGGGRRGGFGGGSTSLPVDDNYLAIRQAVWLATDSQYKSAVETLTQKRAYMKDRDFADRPADFTREEAVQSIGPRAAPLEDIKEMSEEYLRKLSGRFLDYPFIQDSSASLSLSAATTYIVNSEGTRLRKGETSAILRISAEAQAADGERLSDSKTYLVRPPVDLPHLEEVLADVDALAKRLEQTMTAKVLEDYTGPVLFDEAAAPQIFNALLARGVATDSSSVGGGRRRFSAAENLEKYLGKRILPRSFQIYDDPTVASAGGEVLAGHYSHDSEAVPAQRVDVVVDGRLKEMLTSRTPTGESARSNGHGRGGGRGGSQAAAGCLFVESKEGLPPEELKQALIEAAKDQELDYALRITAIRSRDFSMRGGMSMRDMRSMFQRAQGGGMSPVGDPVYVYRVYVEDGREEPVRGCEFGDLEVDDLRDIIAAGNTPAVFNRGGSAGDASSQSVIAPAVIIEELDLFGIEEEREKQPFGEAPHTRKR
jgi:hypothetical protein